MVSHYWWGGKIERADEVVMFIKTRASMSEAVRGAVKELHTYTTPAFMVLPVEDIDSAYHAWSNLALQMPALLPPHRFHFDVLDVGVAD